jgi:hypothetical protein
MLGYKGTAMMIYFRKLKRVHDGCEKELYLSNFNKTLFTICYRFLQIRLKVKESALGDLIILDEVIFKL